MTNLKQEYNKILASEAGRTYGYNKLDERLGLLVSRIVMRYRRRQKMSSLINIFSGNDIESFINDYWKMIEEYREPKSFKHDTLPDTSLPIVNLDIAMMMNNLGVKEFVNLLTEVDSNHPLVQHVDFILFDDNDRYVTILGSYPKELNINDAFIMSVESMKHVTDWSSVYGSNTIIFTNAQMHE